MRHIQKYVLLLTLAIGAFAGQPWGLFADQKQADSEKAPVKKDGPAVESSTTTNVAEPSNPRLMQVPYAADERLYEGDDVITTVNTPMIDDEGNVLLTLTRGLPLSARQIHDQWILVEITYQGRLVAGWVDRKYLALLSAQEPGIVRENINDVPKRLAELHASSEAHLSRSEFVQSLQACSTLLTIDPTNALAFYRRGHCQQMLGEETNAIADFDQAIRHEPKYELAYLARGDARYTREEFDQAIADYDSALAADPKSAGALYMRGRCWYAKGDFDKAIADYNSALEISPDYAWAIAHRGDALFAKKEFDAAIADLDKATQIDRTFDWAIARRGDVWFFGKKDVDRAIADYTFAYTLNPRNSWAIHQRGHCLEKKRDFAQALTDYTEAVELDPKYWDFRTNLAWVLATCPDEKLRDGQKAVELSTHACELTDWKDSFSLGTLAAAYAEVGQFDKAVDLAKKAIAQKSAEYDLETAQSLLEQYRANQPYHEK